MAELVYGFIAGCVFTWVTALLAVGFYQTEVKK